MVSVNGTRQRPTKTEKFFRQAVNCKNTNKDNYHNDNCARNTHIQNGHNKSPHSNSSIICFNFSICSSERLFFPIEMIVPKKYRIEQGVFIIDSYGHKSKETDLVIFDEMYTPYIFNYGMIKFIPIEAVAAVVQCKSKKVKYKNVTKWRKSIEKLITSMDSVARTANRMVDNEEASGKVTQTATRPIMVLCSIAPVSKNSKLKEDFDMILSVNEKDKKIYKYIKGEKCSLREWNDSLNHSLENMKSDELKSEKEARKDRGIKPDGEQRKNLLQQLKVEQRRQNGEVGENVLLSLIFQFNQLLMVLNNPMLFPHRAYAKCFDEILKELEEVENDEQQE